MQASVKALAVFTFLLWLPAVAFAQAEVTGIVKDASGGALPGVSVEVASPVLIEKTRSVVSSGNGQYRIQNLRPGVYTVTFTLSGFSTVKRMAVELAGTATVTVNADLKVGGIEETITVTGETPLVDVQSPTKQKVFDHELIDTIPTGRLYASLGVLIPGVTSTSRDVGGAAGDELASLTIHGSRNADQRVLQNGVNLSGLAAAGNNAGTVPNMAAAAEMTIDTSAASAELATGGPRINFIPRDGGNTVHGSLFATAGDEDFLVANNLTQRLKDRGLLTANSLRRNWDINPSFGGPIKRDRLWYYLAGRHNGASNYAGGMFVNRNAFNPNAWTYDADTSRPAIASAGTWWDAQVRLTWQANNKNKFAFTTDYQVNCRCPNQVNATTSPEAGVDFRFPVQRVLTAEWSSPLTNRLLIEAVALHRTTRSGPEHLQDSLTDPAQIAAYPKMISVTEQSSGLTYRAANQFQDRWSANFFIEERRRTSQALTPSRLASVISRATSASTYDFQPLSYRFNNGVPNQLTIRATPYSSRPTSMPISDSSPKTNGR